MINPIKSLKVACAEAGISLAQACREAGVHQAVIDKWNRKTPRSFELYNAVMAVAERHKVPSVWHVLNYDKSREWYLSVTGRSGDEFGKLCYIGFNYGKANCFDDHATHRYGTLLSREEFERFIYNPWKEAQAVKNPEEGC